MNYKFDTQVNATTQNKTVFEDEEVEDEEFVSTC
jgi:hypothetical protein